MSRRIVLIQGYGLLGFFKRPLELPVLPGELGFDLVRQRRWAPHCLSKMSFRFVARTLHRNHIIPVRIYKSGPRIAPSISNPVNGSERRRGESVIRIQFDRLFEMWDSPGEILWRVAPVKLPSS